MSEVCLHIATVNIFIKERSYKVNQNNHPNHYCRSYDYKPGYNEAVVHDIISSLPCQTHIPHLIYLGFRSPGSWPQPLLSLNQPH